MPAAAAAPALTAAAPAPAERPHVGGKGLPQPVRPHAGGKGLPDTTPHVGGKGLYKGKSKASVPLTAAAPAKDKSKTKSAKDKSETKPASPQAESDDTDQDDAKVRPLSCLYFSFLMFGLCAVPASR